MPDNRNRFDLNADLSQAKNAFLNDVEAAAEQVKHRLKAAADNEKKQAAAAKSRKISVAVVAVSAVVILLVAYFVVFAKPPASAPTQSASSYKGPKVQIVDNTAPAQKPTTVTTTQPAPAPRQGADAQVVEHPQDEYEQPGSGM